MKLLSKIIKVLGYCLFSIFVLAIGLLAALVIGDDGGILCDFVEGIRNLFKPKEADK